MIGIHAGKGLILFIFFVDGITQGYSFEDGTKMDLKTAVDELVFVGIMKGNLDEDR